MSVNISDEERNLFSAWTELDGDVEGLEPQVADAVVGTRLGYGRGDRARVPYWEVPEGIDCFNDMDYAGDGQKHHRLDLYLPHEAVVRGGATLPVYIDIHGGGFIYGSKELNRNFCTHLAAQGFAVFSLDYRPYPQADFMGQLQDVMRGFGWVKDHMCEYPVDSHNVFVIGDSAGGGFGLYAVALERSADMARAAGMERTGLPIRGAAFISGLFDLEPNVRQARESQRIEGVCDDSAMGLINYIAPEFFASLAASEMSRYVDLSVMTAEVDLPPLFLNTSNDDFLQHDTLALGSLLARNDRDFVLYDTHTAKGESLGHVYPVCLSWLQESREALQRIRDFSYMKL